MRLEYFSVYLSALNYSGSPSTIKWHYIQIHLIMEKGNHIYLNVKTVPAVEPETLEAHTAYTVYIPYGDTLLLASGWTLQDAIELFAQKHSYVRTSLRLKRPFRSQ